MISTASFTTSCGFCGVGLVLPEHKKYRVDRSGAKILKGNNFCDHWCYNQYQKLNGPSPGFAKYVRENRGELIRRGINLALSHKIYTSEFLRKLQACTGSDCAYPNCNLQLSKFGPRSKWNCCSYHTALVTRAIWGQNQGRKNLVKKHGLEPIEQTFKYLPPATLICAKCKKKFVRSGKRALKPRENVFCSKECQYTYRSKSVEISCATCGIKFRRPQSQTYVYDKGGGKKRAKRQQFCSSKCHYEFVPENNQGGRRLRQRIFNCKYCKKEFFTLFRSNRIGKDGRIRKKQQYCCVKCCAAYVRKKGLRRTIELKTVYCLECGKRFKTIYYPASSVSSGKIQKFCSIRCGAFYRGPLRKKVKCLQCKKFFLTPNYKARNLPSGKAVLKQKYCGNKCYKLANQADKKELACKVCGKKFATYYYRDRIGKDGKIHKKQKFCSRKCFGINLLKTGGKNVSNRKKEDK